MADITNTSENPAASYTKLNPYENDGASTNTGVNGSLGSAQQRVSDSKVGAGWETGNKRASSPQSGKRLPADSDCNLNDTWHGTM